MIIIELPYLLRRLDIWWHYRNAPTAIRERYERLSEQYGITTALVEMALICDDRWKRRDYVEGEYEKYKLVRLREVYVEMGGDMWDVIQIIVEIFYKSMKYRPETFRSERFEYAKFGYCQNWPAGQRRRQRTMAKLFSLFPEIQELLGWEEPNLFINPDFTDEKCRRYFQLMREQMPGYPRHRVIIYRTRRGPKS